MKSPILGASVMAKPKAAVQKLPLLEDLLVHPVRRKDTHSGQASGEYKDWIFDHARKAQFYVSGFGELRAAASRAEANYYYSFAPEAREKAVAAGWDKLLGADFGTSLSYNQFRHAILFHKPMYFALAAQVLVACECALGDAIEKDIYAGRAGDVYAMMKIIPACYNVDNFNAAALERLRRQAEDFDKLALASCLQSNRDVLDDLAGGHCVTRRTARLLHDFVITFVENRRISNVGLGEVRGAPGRTLGRKSASGAESIDLDDWRSYER